MGKQNALWHTSKKERLAYNMYFAGQLIFNAFLTGFTFTYLLNAGLNEFLIGSILLIPKIWDAVNDTLFGVIVDKFRFKKGRFMPWVRISAIAMPAATMLFFSMPGGFSESAKIAWVIIGYILWDTAFTISDVPIHSLCTTMTSDFGERTSILSATRIAGGLGGIIASIIIPVLYGENGADLGWSLTAIILSAIGLLLMLPICFLGRERFHTELEKEPSLKDMWKGFIKNRYLLVFQIARFICLLTMSMDHMNAAFAQYVLGDETFASLMSMALGLPIMILAAFMPKIIRKWDKMYVTVFFMAIFSVLTIIQYFTGYQSIAMILLFTALKGAAFGGVLTLSFMFVPDCIEYGHYKNGERNPGVAFGLQTFVNKLDTALVTTLSAYVIALLGFNAQNVTTQGQNAVWLTITIFAAIGPIIAIPVLLVFYKLRDKDVKIMTTYNNKEITREECDELLKGKY